MALILFKIKKHLYNFQIFNFSTPNLLGYYKSADDIFTDDNFFMAPKLFYQLITIWVKIEEFQKFTTDVMITTKDYS